MIPLIQCLIFLVPLEEMINDSLIYEGLSVDVVIIAVAEHDGGWFLSFLDSQTACQAFRQLITLYFKIKTLLLDLVLPTLQCFNLR